MFLRKNKISLTILLLLISIIGFTTNLSAQENIKVGLIYPMTGPLAMVGRHIADAALLAIEIINGEFPDLALDFAPTAGLPNLNGAKIEAIMGNSQGQPEFGRAEAERLITMNKVVALMGCQQSGVTKTASQVAERYKTPFVTAISTSTDLTERGLKYFFRSTFTVEKFADEFFRFFIDLNENKGANIKNWGIIYENNEFGKSCVNNAKIAAEKYGFPLVIEVPFPFGTVELDSEVTLLKQANPDFLLSSIMISDLILLVKTAQKLNYNAPGILGFGGGFMDPYLIETLGEDSEYLGCYNFFALDFQEKIPLLATINKMYVDRYGIDFSGDSIRAFQGMMLLADVINRAGSGDKEKIKQALIETDIPSDQLILPWEGIKFNEKGQNILGKGCITQILEGKLSTVWPFDIASKELVFPLPKWNER